MSLKHLVAVGVLMEACYCLFYASGSLAVDLLLFIGVNAAAYLMLSWTLRRCWKHGSSVADKTILGLILGFGILFRLTLVAHPPVASDDIYRYIWDGRVAVHGINPYAYPPSDERLASLATPDLPSKVNFPWMHSIYPPLAQVLFAASALMFGDSLTGFKLLLTLVDCSTLLVLILFIRRFALKPWLLLLYAWSPLPIMYFSLDGHIDALGIPFLMLFLYLVMTNRKVKAALSLGLSALAKFYPLFVVPFLFHLARGAKRFLLPLIPVALLGLGYLLYYEPSGGLFSSIATFNTHWEFNAPVFTLLLHAFPTNAQAHLASGILFLGWLAWLFFAKKPAGEKVFLAFLGFIILGPVVHPWYLTWLAALLTVRWSTAVFVLLGMSDLSNIVVFRYRTGKGWQDDPLLLVIEFLPFFVLFIWEWMHKSQTGVVFAAEAVVQPAAHAELEPGNG